MAAFSKTFTDLRINKICVNDSRPLHFMKGFHTLGKTIIFNVKNDTNKLDTGGFNLELEQNDKKKRVGIYIPNDTNSMSKMYNDYIL